MPAGISLQKDVLRGEKELEKSPQRTSTQDSDVFSDSPTRKAFNRLCPVGFTG